MDGHFYVYEHWRPDRDVCFWVGKGTGTRAYVFKRNRHYNHVIKKLKRLGMCAEVRLVADGLSEAGALSLEVARIAFWRSAGIKLTNKTDGGEGITGYRHTPEMRKHFSDRLKGKPNPAHSLRMAGRKLSDSHKAAISLGNQGRLVDEATREKIAAPQRGRKLPPAHVEKLRRAQTGKKQAEATKAKRGVAIAETWKDPEIRARRMAWLDDPQKRISWVASLKRKTITDTHRENLKEAAKRDWVRRKSAVERQGG